MIDFGKCEIEVSHKKIVLKEKKSQIIFYNKNQKKIKKIIVDGCVLTEGLRCDYLLIDDFGIEHFVELKGRNIKHAVEQITTTIESISSNPKETKKEAFVVSSRCPLINSEIQTYKLKLKRNLQHNFIDKEYILRT